MEVKVNDLLEITQETVALYRGSRWEENFLIEHVGETVRYGGERDYKEFNSTHILAYQSLRGTWHTPNCPLRVILNMRQAYLDHQEKDNA